MISETVTVGFSLKTIVVSIDWPQVSSGVKVITTEPAALAVRMLFSIVALPNFTLQVPFTDAGSLDVAGRATSSFSQLRRGNVNSITGSQTAYK